MKDDKERNYFSLRILKPLSYAFEKCTTKSELFNSKNYAKKFYTKLQPQMPLHVSTQVCIVTPPCFREKPFYVKLTTFSTAYGTKNQIKPIADPKSTLKINMGSPQTVLQILFMSAVICIQKILHENEIKQYLKNCKYQEFYQDQRELIKLYQLHRIWRRQCGPSFC